MGNGTGGRETETFLRGLGLGSGVQIIMVSESGASIYSASQAAREEFPDLDLTVRGAISIGRRLMDPLAELVKISPQSIGVGQYQHDVDQGLLQSKLNDVVVSCVNGVGVEVNTASAQLLSYVSGLGPSLAKSIQEYRDANGGFKSRRLNGNLFRVSRTDGVAAYAGILSFRIGRTAFSFQHVDAGSGTFYRQVVLNHSLPRLSAFGLHVDQGRSTRYEDAGDHRVLFTFKGTFGPPDASVFYAADTGENQTSVQDTAMLGAAAVAIALLASSGSSSSDTVRRYTVQNDAAWTVLNGTNPTSVRENIEYGGWVYRNSDATYSATAPVKGRVDGVNIGTPDSVPAGTLATSSYHTHGAYDPRFVSETFSPMDLIQDNLWKVDGYLATPSGKFMFHDHETGNVTQLGTVAN